ncbi:bifunctional hydroxymethylpyrimidine kinase/phosphomethylpyrimidine kinase [Deferribacteraceae bacterium V6Fe1]|nr:bifunctional hydroxymethylpyrimidine kinase/phosphomethylpyrimidine kinase [Deferribacteraceae bacterium V6Fe1]
MKIVMTIGGSDPIAGAGIQADIKTISAVGCYGCSVITAVTAQNTGKVLDVYNLPVEIVKAQFRAIVDDLEVDAVKIGMLSSAEIIYTVIDLLKTYKLTNIVVDPVMVSSSGKKLLEDNAISALNELIKLADLVTPNKNEAEVIFGINLEKSDISDENKERIINFGVPNVLIKGGHFDGKHSNDILLTNGVAVDFSSERLDKKDVHGTGCTLSSAIASFLAQENDIVTSVRYAKEYITGAIRNSIKFSENHKQRLINHFYKKDF